MSKISIEILKEQEVLTVKTRITGKTKDCFIKDLEKGYNASDITRHAIRKFYESGGKHDY